MKFRSYQIFYLLSAVLAIAALCSTMLQIIEPSGATNELTNFSYKAADGTVTHSPVAL